MTPTARTLLRVYADVQGPADRIAKAAGATCKSGCDGCCHQLTLCTVFEAELIVDRLLKEPPAHVEALAIRLREEALFHSRPGLTHMEAAGRPCVLLDPSAHRCTVYAQRPLACRFYYVRTDPQLCYVKGGSVEVIRLELEKMLERDLLEEMDEPMLGPLPLTVLRVLCAHPSLSAARWTANLLEGLPTLPEWVMRNAVDLAANFIRNNRPIEPAPRRTDTPG